MVWSWVKASDGVHLDLDGVGSSAGPSPYHSLLTSSPIHFIFAACLATVALL